MPLPKAAVPGSIPQFCGSCDLLPWESHCWFFSLVFQAHKPHEAEPWRVQVFQVWKNERCVHFKTTSARGIQAVVLPFKHSLN